jgi:hypothetical protein
MVPDADRADQDHESYRLLVELWARENPVKTLKLQVLLAVNAILVSALCISGGVVRENWPLALAGAGFSLLWAFSMARTVLFQEAWRWKTREIADRYPGDARFQVLDGQKALEKAPRLLRALGSVPSSYYLLGTPIILCLCWLGALVYLFL